MSKAVQRAGKSQVPPEQEEHADCHLRELGCSKTGLPLATSAKLTQNAASWEGMKIPSDISSS